MAPSEYKLLPNDGYSIRLLTILPNSDPRKTIQCELFHDTANEKNKDRTPYEALSYVWGNPAETRDIQVNGCIFQATVNLEGALRALRKTDRPRVLWVDAIYINQTDIREQGEQVGIMWNIFRAAECVVVWLGPKEGDSAVAMENISRLETQARFASREGKDQEGYRGPDGRRWLASDFKTHPSRIGMRNLAERVWFTRVWVLLEVAAAKRITVVCGNNAVSGEDLYREIKGVGSFYQSFQGFLRKVHFALELMSRSAHDVEAHLRPLIELIENFRTWDATRPVDKVYALRPLSSDASRYLELQPDYTLPQGILAQKLVRSAFPNSVISPLSTTGNEVTFEVKGLLLGTYRSAGGANGDRSWSFSAGKSDLPNAVFNPDVLEIFRENWYIWMVGIRKLHEDGGAVVLLQGASRPTTLRYHGGRYIVDMLATPEPIKERTQFPKLRGEAWSIALKALSAISDGLMKFKLSWDPFRRPYPSEFNIYVPAPNDLRNQWDALIEWCKDEAEEISEDNHDSRLINILVARFYSQTHGLESGTNENTITIHQAAAKGRFRTVKHLLECNAPVNSRDGNTEMTPLHMAAIVGHNRVVKALLDAKAETDSLDRYNATPLWHAIYQGHSKICQILLDAGADPNFSGNELNSPIVTAVDEGYADIVSALLKAGASVECMDPVAGPTFSQLATELGDKGAINALFSSSSELKPQGGYDNDSLSHAAAKGRTEIIKLLLDAGTDVNSQNLVGMTPLDSAVYKGHHKTAEVLWQAGGQLNIIKIFKTMDEDGDLEDEKGTTAWKLIIDRYDL